jgi:glycosyltransferase involved in cell wall biosynthesis
MHVLMTADTVGGVWTYAQELVSGLIRRGNRVTLVSFGATPRDDQVEWMRGLPRLDYRPASFRLEWMQDPQADVAASMGYLQDVIAEVKPDLLHTNQYCYGAVACDIPKILVAHSDVVSWWVGTHGEEPPDSPWIRWYRETVSQGLQSADVVIAPSQWMLDAVCEHYLCPRSRAVIYNGRTPEWFSCDWEKKDFVLTVGRLWDEAKQVGLLLTEECGVPVCIVGCNEEPGTGRQSPGSELVNARLQGSKPHDELRKLFAEASMYAATSRYEPFGLAPLEAAFSRCAIVANDIPVFRELWGDSACYFARNSAVDLMEKLRELASDADLRREYAGASYQTACRRFTADRMVEQYTDLYHGALPAQRAA